CVFEERYRNKTTKVAIDFCLPSLSIYFVSFFVPLPFLACLAGFFAMFHLFPPRLFCGRGVLLSLGPLSEQNNAKQRDIGDQTRIFSLELISFVFGQK